jgi:nicotinamidase-related amidase
MTTAVLLIDLQRDFLDAKDGRLPVTEEGARAVLHAANEILARRALPEALLVLVLNHFPASARLANFFRKGAAVAGSQGAEPDPRLEQLGNATVVVKSKASAFSNPKLQELLSTHQVRDLWVLGVFAEGCVRATVLEALRLGYPVHVLESAVSSSATWKKGIALWAMERAGAIVERGVDVF